MTSIEQPQPPLQNSAAAPANAHAERLGQHSLTYVAGSIVAVAGGVVLLPVYTRALSPADYGILETILRFVNLCAVVAFVGLRQGYLRFYFDNAHDSWQKSLTATTVLGVVLIGSGVMLPVLFGTSFLLNWLGTERFGALSSVLLTLWLIFEAIYTVGLSFLQVRFLSTRYLAAQCGRVVILVGANYSFLHYFGMGLNGALLGNFITSCSTGLIAAILLLNWSGVSISKPTAGHLLRFGLPYIPTAVFAYVISNTDRLTLLHFGFTATLGLLSLASKLGEMALSVLTTPLENIWMPYAFSIYGQPEGPHKIGILYMRYLTIMISIALLISLAAPIAIALLSSEQYADVSELVPIVAIGCIFFSAASLSDLGILIAKKTHIKPYIFGSVAIVAVLLQLTLTPRGGVVGAVTATTLTAITLFLAISVVASRYYRFIVDSKIMLVIVVAAGTALIIGRLIASYWQTLVGDTISVVVGMTLFVTAVHMTRLMTIHDVLAFTRQLLQRNASIQ